MLHIRNLLLVCQDAIGPFQYLSFLLFGNDSLYVLHTAQEGVRPYGRFEGDDHLPRVPALHHHVVVPYAVVVPRPMLPQDHPVVQPLQEVLQGSDDGHPSKGQQQLVAGELAASVTAVDGRAAGQDRDAARGTEGQGPLVCVGDGTGVDRRLRGGGVLVKFVGHRRGGGAPSVDVPELQDHGPFVRLHFGQTVDDLDVLAVHAFDLFFVQL
mmetsp:Transcript_37474/g.87392  ORF Transcript_37474/g.87392 Transcript_37474/m.87392 type:complete len:211 (+) Transcript_37474:402-1034(+)